MGLLANIIIIVAILVVIVLATTFACLAPNTKAGGDQACPNEQSLVNGECKANQYTPCQKTTDCVPNLTCNPDGYCDFLTLATVPTPVFHKVVQMEDPESDGSTLDEEEQVFDVRSASTVVEDDTSAISTPYREDNGVYYCKGPSLMDGSQVIDACSYSSSIIFLLDSGQLIIQTGEERRKLSSNITMKQIINFAGYLTGLSHDGCLMQCDDVDVNPLSWKPIRWSQMPTGIIYINSPYDGKTVAVQTEKQGYVFNESGGLMSTYRAEGQIRVYGKNSFYYAMIDQNTHTVKTYPNGDTYTEVLDAAFDYHGKLTIIGVNDSEKYRKIAMVGWKPFFIC